MVDDKQYTMANGRLQEATQEAEHVEKRPEDGLGNPSEGA